MPALALLAGACVVQRGFVPDRIGPERAPHVPDELLVRFGDGTDSSERDAVLSLVGASLVEPEALLPGLYLIRVGIDLEGAILRLESQPEVLYAHPNYWLFPTGQTIPKDPNFSQQWGLWVVLPPLSPPVLAGIDGPFQPLPIADINAPAAWDVHTGMGSFVIAVIDSGLKVDAPDFTGNLWEKKPGEVGWDFLKGSPVTFDTNGHGTRMASIIGARANDNSMDSVVGVIWSCKLMPLRFIGMSSAPAEEVLEDKGTTADAIAAIKYSADHGALVSNNSYGARKIADATGMIEAIEYAGKRGQLFVTSAGNLGGDLSKVPFYPAAFDLENMVVVTSIDHESKLMNDVGWGESVVDIAAPGREIYSIHKNGAYGFASHGTSFATAFVSGAAALVWDFHPDWTFSEVKERILTSARVDLGLKSKIAGGRVLDLGNLLSDVIVVDVSTLQWPGSVPDEMLGSVELRLEQGRLVIDALRNGRAR